MKFQSQFSWENKKIFQNVNLVFFSVFFCFGILFCLFVVFFLIVRILTITILWANSTDDISIFFFFFKKKLAVIFNANCLLVKTYFWDSLHELWRQFAGNIKAYFLGKIRKIFQNVVCWNFYPVCSVKLHKYASANSNMQTVQTQTAHTFAVWSKSTLITNLIWDLKASMLASVFEWNAHPTGDQEVADSISAWSGDGFWNIFYSHPLPLSLAVVSFWRKNKQKHWVTA